MTLENQVRELTAAVADIKKSDLSTELKVVAAVGCSIFILYSRCPSALGVEPMFGSQLAILVESTLINGVINPSPGGVLFLLSPIEAREELLWVKASQNTNISQVPQVGLV